MNHREFAVMDRWLYYVFERKIKMCNLSTGEVKPLEIEDFEGSYACDLFCVNGRLNVLCHSPTFAYYYFGELELDNTNRQFARFRREESVDNYVCPEAIWPSVVSVGGRIFCLENYRFYKIDGWLDSCHCVFTWKGRICYVTKENNQFFLNSFLLEPDSSENLRQPLMADEAIMSRLDQGTDKQLIVFEDIVYIFISSYHYRICLLELNLRDNTVKGITDNVKNLTDIRFIWRTQVDGKAIYVTGLGEPATLAMWKLEIISTAHRDEFCCGICLQLFEVPKVLPCGHSICASCEEALKVAGPGNKKTLVCPFCRKSVDLEANESLPRNYALTNVMENSINTPKEQEDLFLCFTCGKNREKDNCLLCETCMDTEKKTVLVCAICVLKKHKDHRYEEVKSLSQAEKEREFDLEATDLKPLTGQFLLEFEYSVNRHLRALKQALDTMENMKKKVVMDDSVTSAHMKSEIEKYKELASKARCEKKALKDWMESVLPTLRG
uniref:RING-type domain-containing protein n=1 Tax=Steinernema glaseri TaxID=37863 RepID=A0A1I7YN99_9BILA